MNVHMHPISGTSSAAGVAEPAFGRYIEGMKNAQQLARTIAAECACLRLRGAARTMTRYYDAELREAGLRLSQLTLLVGVAMFPEGEAAMKPLSEALVMDRTTLTRNLQPLIKQGWLSTGASKGDARSRVVDLTPTGEKALEAAFPLWKRAQAAAKKEFGAAHLASLGNQLDQLLRRQ
jgi:DNA-binding MarR family transcriptional regulator